MFHASLCSVSVCEGLCSMLHCVLFQYVRVCGPYFTVFCFSM